MAGAVPVVAAVPAAVSVVAAVPAAVPVAVAGATAALTGSGARGTDWLRSPGAAARDTGAGAGRRGPAMT